MHLTQRLFILGFLLLGVLLPLLLPAQNNTLSKVWVPDLSNGSYKNPLLYADYSDPDVVRVGSDYYLTSSSFNCAPDLQILHSRDLVNWNIIGTVFSQQPPKLRYNVPQHGNGVWAPAIRYHRKKFYIYYPDPDLGLFVTRADNPAGPWVDTPSGEDWFLHFQDQGPYGRVVHLQPMAWKNAWPIIGTDPDGDGKGEPVLTHRKPTIKGRPVALATPATSDDFEANTLGLQ